MPKSYKCPVPMPKFILIEETEEYIIKEYRAFYLLDWMNSVGLSFWSSREIYKKRQRLLMELAHKEKELEGGDWTVKRDSLEYGLDSDDNQE